MGPSQCSFFFSVSPLEVASRDLRKMTFSFLCYVIEKIFPAAFFIAQLMLCDPGQGESDNMFKQLQEAFVAAYYFSRTLRRAILRPYFHFMGPFPIGKPIVVNRLTMGISLLGIYTIVIKMLMTE